MSANKLELVEELKRSKEAAFEHLNTLEQLHKEKLQVLDELLQWLEETCDTFKH